MTINYPTSYDTEASLFGDVDDMVVVTLNGAINSTATALTFNETSMVDGLDVDTELAFQGQGSGPVTATAVQDDMSLIDGYTGQGKLTDYRVEIDGTGTPNTFKWSRDGGSTWEETGVNCVSVGTPYELEEGLEVYWTGITGHTMGDRWDWEAGFEIVRIDSHGATGVLNVTRAFNGTTAQSHADDAQATQDPSAYDWTQLVEALIAAEKYKGLVGTDASKGSPSGVGQVYIATDTEIVYVCTDGANWDVLAITDHGALGALTADDHTQYHTEARKITWHNAITGDHIQTIAHDHRGSGTYGNPIKKFTTGTDASKGSPSVVGQVYYAYDSNNLYFSADGSSWTRYASMPTGSILYFESACPSGWSELAAVDGTFLKGAESGVWSSLGSGGATTHVHEMQDVVNHSHDVSAQTGRTSSSDGSHTHGFDIRAGTGGLTRAYYYTSVSTSYLTSSGAGSHTHTITIAAYDTADYGDNPANTDSESSLPAYYKLMACERD